MDSTPIKTTYTNNFKFSDNLSYYQTGQSFDGPAEKISLKELDGISGYLDFRSSNKKILITLSSGMFHFWYDSVGTVLTCLEENPGSEVIVDYSRLKLVEGYGVMSDSSYYNLFLEILKKNGVQYKTICSQHYGGMIVDNFYQLDQSNRTNNPTPIIYRETRDYVKNKDVVPHRVVYLSRTNYESLEAPRPDLKPGTLFKTGQRVINEKVLEDYLKENGIEIVVPEHFASFKEQIDYFSEVKTVISVTSSGLTNAIFMKPESNVVEITTPLLINTFFENGMWDAMDELHHLYELISFEKNHKRFSIPNQTKQAEEIVEYLKRNNVLKAVGAL
jgi:hypothetical protein